jgi:transcriptional regulator GlxA family with amidase domain
MIGMEDAVDQQDEGSDAASAFAAATAFFRESADRVSSPSSRQASVCAKDTEAQRLSNLDASGDLKSLLASVMRVMEDNLETPLTLRELTAASGVSASTHERPFADQFGQSPIRSLSQCKAARGSQ